MKPIENPDQVRDELRRLITDPGYLRLRRLHLQEFQRANEEWRHEKLEGLPRLQERAQTLFEVLELPDTLYRRAGGEGRLFPYPSEEPKVVRPSVFPTSTSNS